MAASFITGSLAKHAGDFYASGVRAPIHLDLPHVYSPPSCVDRLTVAVSGAAPGARTSTRLPQADMIGDLYVVAQMSATDGGGSYDPYFGINLIESLTIRIGSTRICEIENFRAALKAAVILAADGRAGKAEAVLGSLGPAAPGANTAYNVAIPIPWAYSSLINSGKGGKYLPAHLARSGAREVSIDLTFGAAADLFDGTGTAPSITSCSIVAHTLVMGDAERLEAEAQASESGYTHHFADIQSIPLQAIGSATTTSIDLSAFRGTMAAAFFFNTASTFAADGKAFGDDSLAYVNQLTVDGRVLEIAGSASERRLEVAEHELSLAGSTVINGIDTVAVPLALSPGDPAAFTGGLVLRDVRVVSASYVSGAAGQVEVAITSSAAIALEHGSFVLLR